MKSHFKAVLKWLLTSLWFLTLCSACVVGYHFLIPPVTEAQWQRQQTELTEHIVQASQKEHDARQQALDAISASLNALTRRVDAQAEQIGRLTEQQSQQGDSLSALGMDKAAVERLEKKLTALERQVSQKLQAVRAPAPAKAVTPQSKRHARVVTPKPANVPTPPFVLFDVQKRGNVYLAIVGKPTASTLSELSAVRAGQRYLGWQVGQIQPNNIRASYQGQTIVMEVKA